MIIYICFFFYRNTKLIYSICKSFKFAFKSCLLNVPALGIGSGLGPEFYLVILIDQTKHTSSLKSVCCTGRFKHFPTV